MKYSRNKIDGKSNRAFYFSCPHFHRVADKLFFVILTAHTLQELLGPDFSGLLEN